jgi:hypothetical protein
MQGPARGSSASYNISKCLSIPEVINEIHTFGKKKNYPLLFFYSFCKFFSNNTICTKNCCTKEFFSSVEIKI